MRSSSRRSSLFATFGLGLALIAFVTQISLPWIKGSHDARERGPVANALTIVSIDSSPVRFTRHLETQPHHGPHDGTTCPVCRLVGQSRSALAVATLRSTAVAVTHRAAGVSRRVAPERFSDNAAAPRAPPLLLG